MPWPRAVPLSADRLCLEPLTVEHADVMVDVLAPVELYHFTGGGPPSLEELRARYTRQVRGRSQDGTAGWLNWIIRPRQGRAPIGFVQATLHRTAQVTTADLAWLVTPSAQGHGFATESAERAATWLRSVDVRELRARIHPEHGASARVALRIVMHPTITRCDGEVLWRERPPASDEC
ncbi:GNAT family N-acetyltransferase [Curtobacterium sp. P97]|uniref:GNAT family N-acetyltransferase n=1 Tax=Curtobacterium sp. P97 TaxID=2939562 RepID=UPI00204209C7|nr:GNAT family N-acetyltransferase [Curtobacterium sp. P97]MCM3520336.1 GNAT family N-acetyltransferase [Curtobacterium sp. P97]